MKSHTAQYQFASPISQMMIEGMQEMIGRSGLYAVFNLANLAHLSKNNQTVQLWRDLSFGEVTAIQSALEELYGPRSGRGMILRSGRAAYKFLQRQCGEDLGLTRLDYRLLPTPARIKKGMEAVAELLSGQNAEKIQVVEDEQSWFWRIERCAWCCDRNEEQKICQFYVGLLDEYATWAGGGKIFHVEEVECQASGSPNCLIRIDKQPFD
jgi:predicted hydrocarbon binding protein